MRELLPYKILQRKEEYEMKKISYKKIWLLIALAAILTCILSVCVFAADSKEAVSTDSSETKESSSEADVMTAADSSSPEVYIENFDVTGMSVDEVQDVINHKLDTYADDIISIYVDTNTVNVTAGELGLTNADTTLAYRAANLEINGNVLQRYTTEKYMTDNGPLFFQLDLRVDEETVRAVVTEKCSVYNNDPVNMQVNRDADTGAITVTPKHDGYYVDVETTTAAICQYLNNNWHGGYGAITATLNRAEARGSEEDAALMTDVIGGGSTTYDTSESEAQRNNNLMNAVNKINGTVLYPGEEYSVESALVPFTEENGYMEAGAQENGRLVKELGGGVCQVSTTLYQAVLAAELEVTERHEHSMVVSYVDPSKDAAIAEGAKDFKFVNNTDTPIYIAGYIDAGVITFQIIGHETRDPSRTVEYISETSDPIEVTIAYELDPSLPVGTIEASSGHTGMDAKLYKVVKENGVEVSREIVNTSSYEMSPETYVIGTGGIAASVQSQLESAIAQNADPQTVCGIVEGAYGEASYVTSLGTEVNIGGTTAADGTTQTDASAETAAAEAAAAVEADASAEAAEQYDASESDE